METGTVNNKAEIPDTGMYDFQVSATHFSVNENALVKISGDSLSLAKMLIVGEQRFPVVISGKTGYTLIPRHTFAASEQFLGILMTNGKIHAFSEGVEFSGVKSEVFIRRITPSVVSSGEVSYIVLQ